MEALDEKLLDVATYLEPAREDILAFTAFPPSLWKQIWSNNPLSVNRPSGGALRLAA